MPSCPSNLRPVAKKKWKELAPELFRLGLLTVVDGDALAVYCQAWAKWVDAEKRLQKDGQWIEMGEKGYIAEHPAAKSQRAAEEKMKAFGAMFGLNPADRARLAADAEGDASDDSDEAKFFGTVG